MRFAADGFDWDEGNRTKCEKHGVTITEIESVFGQNDLLVMRDERHSDREERFILIGRDRRDRPMFVCFTWRRRGDANLIRPISARRMRPRERKAHERRLAQRDRSAGS